MHILGDFKFNDFVSAYSKEFTRGSCASAHSVGVRFFRRCVADAGGGRKEKGRSKLEAQKSRSLTPVRKTAGLSPQNAQNRRVLGTPRFGMTTRSGSGPRLGATFCAVVICNVIGEVNLSQRDVITMWVTRNLLKKTLGLVRRSFVAVINLAYRPDHFRIARHSPAMGGMNPMELPASNNRSHLPCIGHSVN